MLSILIPIYNYNVVALVNKLLNESELEQIKFEIICIDDLSTDENIKQANKTGVTAANCIYEELSANIGRSKIRNLLAKKAKYQNLIFLDCDVMPTNNSFIKDYVSFLKKSEIVFGGILTPEIKNKNQILHYKYGKFREEKLDFITQNFAIKKAVFNCIKFDESIESYGFEDLVFYNTLLNKKIAITKINNPVFHLGIVKNNKIYIEKEKESLQTLKKLFKNQKLAEKDVKLLKYYNKLNKTRMLGVYKAFFKVFKGMLYKNITSKSPSLFIFDLYRLGYFCKL